MKAYKNIILVAVLVFAAGAGGGKPSVSTFTDKRDGKIYRIVEIGGAVWMAENLNYAAEGSVCYNNSADSCAKYGRLYNWKTAIKACPAGFHLASYDEWRALVNYAGGGEKAGKKLKSKAGWNNNGNGTDDYGWSALPGGYGYGSSDGDFRYVGFSGLWWSATEDGANLARHRDMNYGGEYVGGNTGEKARLFSVRCVQDSKEGKR
jgi:uncharacterized protein (TIGR02145 family)